MIENSVFPDSLKQADIKGATSGLRKFLAIESHLKVTKQLNSLIRKIKLISNFMTSQPG